MKVCGIYSITNPKNKVYIGQSVNIFHRWARYKCLQCKAQQKLYNSLKKYGAEKHKFTILCECDKEKLNELEKYYVDLYNTYLSEYGLNLKDGGGQRVALSEESKKKIGDANRGRKVSDATRKKLSISVNSRDDNYRARLSKSKIGKKHTQETKDKMRSNYASLSIEEKKRRSEAISNQTKGKSKNISDATRLKIINNAKNRVFSAETRKKISENMKGNTFRKGYKDSEETRRKVSERLIGNTRSLGFKHTEETLKKMSIANKGKKHSEETKKKLSEIKKGTKPFLGKKHTEEWKAMMSERNKGQVSWAKGMKFSDEHRRKISESGKKTRNKVKYELISEIVQTLINNK